MKSSIKETLNSNKTFLLVLAASMIIKVKCLNCFYDNQFSYIYNLPDYSGNFSNVREYAMKKNMQCDFLIDTDNKVTWYNKEINMTYQVYQDNKDGTGCKSYSDPQPYISGKLVKMGDVNNNACLVRYVAINFN